MPACDLRLSSLPLLLPPRPERAASHPRRQEVMPSVQEGKGRSRPDLQHSYERLYLGSDGRQTRRRSPGLGLAALEEVLDVDLLIADPASRIHCRFSQAKRVGAPPVRRPRAQVAV